MNSGRFCLLIFFAMTAFFLPVFSASAEDDPFEKDVFEKWEEDSPQKKQAPREQAKKEARKKPFRGFGKYRLSFKKACELADADGQLNWLADFVKNQAASMKECVNCRKLYVTLTSVCAVKSKIVPVKTESNPAGPEDTEHEEPDADTPEHGPEEGSENGQPAAVPATETGRIIKQANPSTELLDTLSRMSWSMASDEGVEIENMKVLRHLADAMRRTDDKSKTEAVYYDIFAEYLMSAFESLEVGKEEDMPDATPVPQNILPERSVDSLFDF